MAREFNYLRVPPARGILVNDDYEDGDSNLPRSMEFFFNPASLNFDMSAEWARIPVPGLSHEVLQYSHTVSNELSFVLQWNSIIAKNRQSGSAYARQFERNLDKWTLDIKRDSINKAYLYKEFLYALVLPIKEGRAPSRVSLIWPNFLHTRCVVTDVSFTFNKFGHDGEVMSFDADIKMVEIRRVFVSREAITNYFERTPVDMVFTPAEVYPPEVKPKRRSNPRRSSGGASTTTLREQQLEALGFTAPDPGVGTGN